jgi:hypothetical protein
MQTLSALLKKPFLNRLKITQLRKNIIVQALSLLKQKSRRIILKFTP